MLVAFMSFQEHELLQNRFLSHKTNSNMLMPIKLTDAPEEPETKFH
jgi:hypothetical protein